MIEKIYKNKCMVICDNCGIGQECYDWADAIDFMNEEGWKKKLADGEWKHYCPECQEEGQLLEKIAEYFVFHEKEKKLIKFIRELQFGEVTIKVQDGLPVLIEESIKKVKL